MKAMHRYEPCSRYTLGIAVAPAWCLVWLFGMILAAGCTAPPAPPGNNNDNDNDNGPDNPLARTCIGCHTDESLLRQVAREEPPPPADAGEG